MYIYYILFNRIIENIGRIKHFIVLIIVPAICNVLEMNN